MYQSVIRKITGTKVKPKNKACMSIIIFNKINKQLLIPTPINQMTLINVPKNSIESCRSKKIKNVVEIIPKRDSSQALFSFQAVFSLFSTSRALYFHAIFSCSLLLLKSPFSAISFQSSPSSATHLLHCFNRCHGLRVVTSLPRVLCMQLHRSCPSLQTKYLQFLSRVI